MVKCKSQTATEYLIILALVIVIALIVVVVLEGVPSIGGRASINAQLAQSRTLPIGIENIAYTAGGIYLVIRNNRPDSITIKNITLDGKLSSFNGVTFPFLLKVGQTKKLSGYVTSLDGVVDCVITYKTSDEALYVQNFTFNYRLPATDITEGLVGYWSFDSYNNTHVYDLKGNLTGSFQGNAHIINNAVLGKGLSFDGDSDYVYFNKYYYDFNTEGFTYSFWVNAQDLPKTNYAQDVIINSYLDADNGITIYIVRSSSDIWSLGMRQEMSSLTESIALPYTATPEFYNKWAHVAITWDTSDHKIYINGQLKISEPATGAFDHNMGIYYFSTSSTAGLNGSLDEVMVWNRALSAQEIISLYSIGR